MFKLFEILLVVISKHCFVLETMKMLITVEYALSRTDREQQASKLLVDSRKGKYTFGAIKARHADQIGNCRRAVSKPEEEMHAFGRSSSGVFDSEHRL